jgi:outer membrane protein assembly factor BamE (lipoprotein component of BamABCDE complex)
MHTELQRALRLFAIVALGASLSGCLPIPVPRTSGANSAYRTEINDRVPESLVQGSTTRRQVLLELGEPDGRGSDDEWFTYQSVSRRGGLRWAVFIDAVFAGGVTTLDSWDTARRLTIRFDEQGIVSSVSLERKNCTDKTDFLQGFDCPSASGDDLAKADMKRRDEQLIASSGAVLGRYKYFPFAIRRGSSPKCSYEGHLTELVANGKRGQVTLIVTQRRLLWQRNWGGDQFWDSVAYEDIEDVKPIMEGGLMHHRVPMPAHDGSCLFLESIDNRTLEKIRGQIVAALAAARTGDH